MTNELFPPGTVIDGRYRITRPLGAGGFARVYEAEHVQLERRAALKILNYVAEPGDNFYRRFVREAKIAANLDHPNVVTIFDFGIVAERSLPYIAMEALDGHDLYEELQMHGPMKPARALPLFRDAIEAIGEGHRRGIVHKDLKPSNLFLVKPGTAQERMVVVDYGIARLHDDPDGQLTQTGALSGTPAYLAPEYFHDQSVTPALDVYQMGLIIAETLTGKRVVDASTPVAIAVAHTSGQHNISAALMRSPVGAFLEKSLRVDPRERFRDCNEMLRALEQVPDPRPDVSFAVVDVNASKNTHTPEAFAETAMTPSGDFQPAPATNDWGGSAQRGAAPASPRSVSGGGNQTSPGGPGPTPSQPMRAPVKQARPHAPTTRKSSGSGTKVLIFAGILGVAVMGLTVMLGLGLFLIGDSESSGDFHTEVESPFGVESERGEGSAAMEGLNVPVTANDYSLAPGTPRLNQKLYGYLYTHALLFSVPYLMQFYDVAVENNGLENGSAIIAPPDMGKVFDMALGQASRAFKGAPKLDDVDAAASDYVATFRRFRPVLEDANDYYSVHRTFEEDDMAGGRKLHERIEKTWPPFREAEEEFALSLYEEWVDQQSEMAKRLSKVGNDPVREKAARLLQRGAELMIAARTEPGSDRYAARLKAYDTTFRDYKDFVRARGGDLDGTFGLMDPHRGLVQPAKDLSAHAHKYVKSRAESKERAEKFGRAPNPVPEIQFMTQAFHQMAIQQNQMMAN